MSSFKTIIAPDILLPKKGIDLTKYAVIACDQFTSQKDYWDKLQKEIGNSVSTLHMIFPEAYLDLVDKKSYINDINQNIDRYLKNKDLIDIGKCFVLVERTTPVVKRRLGLIIAIDLEDYTYEKGVHSLIRASEATIVERIPPRLMIRKDAPIELPHILFLFDDPKKEIIEGLYRNKENLSLLYDFGLNMGGGHLKGYKVSDTSKVIEQFEKLSKENANDLLFIVGDGNHSLATAKAHWDNLKSSLSNEKKENHPARFALVEAMNIYDEGLVFAPIHRAIFNASDDFVPGLKKVLVGGGEIEIYSSSKGKEKIAAPKSSPNVYKAVQDYIDEYLKSHPKASVDYIHDESSLIDVVNKAPNSIAVIMPSLTKDDLFDFIAKDAVLPRKSFSMGHAEEKRYYLEAKRIL